MLKTCLMVSEQSEVAWEVSCQLEVEVLTSHLRHLTSLNVRMMGEGCREGLLLRELQVLRTEAEVEVPLPASEEDRHLVLKVLQEDLELQVPIASLSPDPNRTC
jgi:hypothetical protein